MSQVTGEMAVAGEQKWASRAGSWLERRTPLLFVLPAVVLLLGLGLFPLIYSFGISFTRWDLQDPVRSFVGLQNYVNVLKDARMLGALRNTLIIMVAGVTLELVLGLALAQLLVEPLPGKRFILPLLVLPAVVSPIVVGFTWRILYDASFGPIDYLIGLVAGKPAPIVWLVNIHTVYPAIILTEIWQWTPFMFLIMLAGLSSVSPELHEAAQIDGATGWQIFTRVTLPVIRPVIVVAVLFRALDIFKLFDIILPMTGGGPGTATETASLYLYITGFKNFRLGYTAAASYVVLILFSVLLTLLLRRLGDVTE